VAKAFTHWVANLALDESSLVYKPNFNLRGPERLVVRFDEIRPLTTS
jgi:hypothetical protein